MLKFHQNFVDGGEGPGTQNHVDGICEWSRTSLGTPKTRTRMEPGGGGGTGGEDAPSAGRVLASGSETRAI